MAQIYLRQAGHCQEHPHRPAGERCDRCRLPFCADCLSPTERRADGTRDWFCRACAAELGRIAAHLAYQRSLRVRLTRAVRTGQRLLAALAVFAVLAGSVGAVALAAGRYLPRTAAGADARLDARCGELSRIRSVGAIGTQAPEDAVNVLAYPQRAAVRLLRAAASPGQAALPLAASDPGAGVSSDAGIQALVDECDAGWRHEGSLTLPASLVLDTGRQGSYVQRFALWQDPQAPRDAWVRDFELLASVSDTGDDFVPIRLDRPAQLRETVEPQWFEVVRPAPGGLGTPFPDVVEMRRLQVRVLSTVGSVLAGQSSRAQTPVPRVALGEVAAYGPDVEVIIGHPTVDGSKDRSQFAVGPAAINALAGRPKFILFLNQTTTAEPHLIVSVGQERNLEVRIAPGDAARSGQFIAGRPGRYEFFCRTPGHAPLGLTGTIIVR